MKLCGRIDCDRALLQYRYLLHEMEEVIPLDLRATGPIIARRQAKRSWRRRLTDALH